MEGLWKLVTALVDGLKMCNTSLSDCIVWTLHPNSVGPMISWRGRGVTSHVLCVTWLLWHKYYFLCICRPLKVFAIHQLSPTWKGYINLEHESHKKYLWGGLYSYENLGSILKVHKWAWCPPYKGSCPSLNGGEGRGWQHGLGEGS